ncbi:sigma-70 family RNA polymerase sigma factor [Chitinophaga sp. Cy-1792]|uniref:RNA polymerase sigma factor n=1 Tax=Chitinophaga sp. Cy-1792 TaxID=2608339 RepID=UPI00141DF749|nr:sigma-70 family RNA polymerase sigma factor [Chitinophaga sp. Cy-1792]
MDRLLAGDPQAREFLYDRFSGALYGVVLQLVPIERTANDVIVRVYIWAFQNIGTFRNSGYHTLFAWMLRKTRELAIKEAIPETALTGAELMKQEEGMLQRFYLELPIKEQQVFRLCYFKGLSITTIARMLALPDEQVNELLSSAMKAFRKYIKESWN